mmetsp:Transcript_10455/g.18295  ORF Transcript_10455/g.18295 Transcript_10455/m.18295 type:complete len:273 (-) Transcript_10455:38-856(-)
MSLDPAGTHINAGLSQANVALLDRTDSERLGDLHHGSSIDAGSQSALPIVTPFRRPSVSNSDSGVDSSEKGDDDDKKGSKKKKHRMGPEQLQILQEHFRRNERLDAETKSFLAEKLKLPPRQIEVWFQNCRVRAKKKKTEERCAYFKEKYQQQLAAQANLEEDNKRLQRDNAQLKRYIRALLVSTASHIPPHILTANLVAANLLPDAGTGPSSMSAMNTSMSSTDRLLLEDSLSSLSPNLRAQGALSVLSFCDVSVLISPSLASVHVANAIP